MADIRIKDLTTTASSTASDDFIAVDGTTNGTRKLSAFSPSFGGNINVTGTAQAGGFHVPGNGASKPAGTDSYLAATATTSIPLYVSGFTGGGQSADILRVSLNSSSDWFAVKGNGQVTCLATTASTTTSSGALVVGNGTSGGLGVGGAIVAGGTITSTASTDSGLLQLNLVNSSTGTSASSLFRFNAGTRTATLQAYNDTHATLAGQLRVGTSNGDIVVVPSGVATATFSGSGLASFGGSVTSRIDVNGSTSAGLGLRQTGVRDWFLSAESNELRVSCLTAASIFAFNSGTPVAMRDSTASTSTSSGALVVSGGVGVAGAVFTGGYVHPGGDSTFYIRGTGSNNGLIRGNVTSVDVDTSFGVRNGDGSSTYLSIASTGLIAAIPATAPSLTVNGTMTFERTSNTSLKISVRGTDGTTRSVSLTLA